jgi:hypothetical protein
MLMIGCDFHTRFQQIAMLDPETGELTERRLEHATGEAVEFYGQAFVRHGKEILRRTKVRFAQSSSDSKFGEPSTTSRVCDERSDKNRRPALDPAPGSKSQKCVLTTPAPL